MGAKLADFGLIKVLGDIEDGQDISAIDDALRTVCSETEQEGETDLSIKSCTMKRSPPDEICRYESERS